MKNVSSHILPCGTDKIRKLVIIGVGSELMQDDAAGIEVTKNLTKIYGEGNRAVKIITGYTTPENFTGEIIDFSPDHIIIIDTADLKQKSGTISSIPVEAINDHTLGTHKLSLIMMIKYLKEVIHCEFNIFIIQYKSIEFDCKMTREVKKGVKQMTALLSDMIDAIAQIMR